jgi:predicted outer membrane repeat protein
MDKTTASGLLIAALGLNLFAASETRADVYRVGSGPNCTHRTLDDAQLAARARGGRNTIQLPQRVPRFSRIPLAGDLELIGGYDDQCGLMVGTPSVLNGGDSQPGLEVLPFGDQEANIQLRNLRITHARTRADGAGLSVHGAANVELFDVTIDSSTAAMGGGISLWSFDGKAPSLFLHHTIVLGNIASSIDTGWGEGGGIICVSGNVLLDATSEIIGNQARVGGGVTLRSCVMAVAGGDGARLNIANNTALVDGGGIYADNSYLETSGGRFTVSANYAGESGGGLYLRHTWAMTWDVELTGNKAKHAGGGLYADRNSFVQIADSGLCRGCSTFKGNSVEEFLPFGGGSAAWLGGTASLSLSGARVLENGADDRPWAPVFDVRESAFLRVDGMLLSGNRGASLFSFAGHGNSDLQFVTSAGNHVPDTFRARDNATLSLTRSIVSEDEGGAVLLRDGPVRVSMDCLLTHANRSIPDAQRSMVGNPYFENGYRLSLDSPAIDACNAPSSWGVRDLDNNLRNTDLAKPNRFGAFDLGAYERQP